MATNPVVHLTFEDQTNRRFATAISLSIKEDSRWGARCEASGAIYHQGSEEEAVSLAQHLLNKGYTKVAPEVVLGPEPLRTR